MRIDVSAICKSALAEGCGEENLEDGLKLICRRLYGDQEAEAHRAILRSIDMTAERDGLSRLAAARKLSEGMAVVELKTGRSLEDLPPELREEAAERIRSGKPGVVEHAETRTWSPADGPPPKEMLEAVEKAGLGKPTVESDGRVVVREGAARWQRPLIVVGVTLLVLVALAFAALLRMVAGAGKASLGKAVAALEERQRLEPEDPSVALDLAAAYGRKVIAIRVLSGARQAGRGAGGAGGGRMATVEKALGVSSSPEELLATARQGEEIVRRLLDRPDLSNEDKGTLDILLGIFLLAQGKPQEALEASAAAAALDPQDPRPHLLNADVSRDAHEYEQALAENNLALGKFDAWALSDPSRMRWFLWEIGPGPYSNPDRWQTDGAGLSDDLKRRIEMRSTFFRTMAGSGPQGGAAPEGAG